MGARFRPKKLPQPVEAFADAAADFGVADATDVQEVVDSLRGPGA